MIRVWSDNLFFFNDTATTEIYTLSLHDALPICHPPATSSKTKPARSWRSGGRRYRIRASATSQDSFAASGSAAADRSEEHTSELQSRQYLVCRLLLEKKKTNFLLILLHFYIIYC